MEKKDTKMSRTKSGNLIGRAASAQKRDIREALSGGMNARQQMIEEIKQMFGDTAKFNDWYNRVYKLRSAGEDKKYEQTIRRKYRYMLKKVQAQAPSPAPLPPMPCTEGMSPYCASEALSLWLAVNWHQIPEVSY